jgi:hypothetical protein
LLLAEEELHRVLGHLGGHLMGGVAEWLHRDPGVLSLAMTHVREADERKLRHRGWKDTIVDFLGGASFRFTTPYLSTDREGLPGRRRAVGHRGDAGAGCYPLLELVGVLHQATPALASEVARQTVRCASFEEASEALEERGIEMDVKAVRTLALAVGNEALEQRDLRVAAAATGATFSEEFAGKRIVISTDGGRLRTREGGKRGRKRKNGRRRFRTPWKEPKIVIAYVIDENGRMERTGKPVYDGTLGDADAAFRILTAELRLRGASRATEIIMEGDGSAWIWNRVDALALALGFAPEKIVRVADFYHAVEHLGRIAELKTKWTEAERKKWVRTLRRLLKKGQVEKVIDAARQLCRGRKARQIATEIAYFEERKEFMHYDQYRSRGIPLGSGGVESAVRRVVNLRMKGVGIFWRVPAAEAMLHLRAYLKAGRWSEIINRVIHRSADGHGRAFTL